MTTIFRLEASIRLEGSVTRAVADTLESTIAEELGDTPVIRRGIGTTPVASDLWPLAAFAGLTPEGERNPEQDSAIAAAKELADEIIAGDVLVFAVPRRRYVPRWSEAGPVSMATPDASALFVGALAGQKGGGRTGEEAVMPPSTDIARASCSPRLTTRQALAQRRARRVVDH